MKVKVGDKVYIPREKRPYTVQARDERYIICTKHVCGRVDYFIVDMKEKRRAPDDRLFSPEYNTQADCEERLKELQSGKMALSFRRGIDLDIDIE